MARTELPNGVILPAEYSDDWFEDMTSNLTKLDDVIGSDSKKLNADGVSFLRMSSAALTDGGTGNFSDLNSSYKIKTGDFVLDSGRKLYQVVSVDSTNERFTVGNSLFKVTAESDLAPVAESGDYDDLDNKPDLNPYDQHLASTEIHVTTADKNKWNAVTSKANDSDVVHRSGNETIGGTKTFTDINAISNSAEIGVSGGNNSFKVLDKNKKTISRLEGGTFSGGMAYSQWLLNNGSDTFNGLSLYQPSANLVQLRPYSSTLNVQLGVSNRSFSDCYTSKINGLEPSSLSLPVFPSSSSSIDISAYITDMTGSVANRYTPPANGYITFVATGSQVQIFSDYGLQSKFSIQSGSTIRGYHPVLKNEPIKIYMIGTSIESFRFIPCQGNV